MDFKKHIFQSRKITFGLEELDPYLCATMLNLSKGKSGTV